MSKSRKVEEQKGPINPHPMTSKQMPHSAKQLEKAMENAITRSNQTLELHEPKK